MEDPIPKELRNTGLTTYQMKRAPHRALYLVAGNLRYYMDLRRTIDRSDLVVIDPRAFQEAGRGATNHLIVDHAYWLNPDIRTLSQIIAHRKMRRR